MIPSPKPAMNFTAVNFMAARDVSQMVATKKTFHHPDRTVEQIYQATLRKTDLLHAAGYTVIEI